VCVVVRVIAANQFLRPIFVVPRFKSGAFITQPLHWLGWLDIRRIVEAQRAGELVGVGWLRCQSKRQRRIFAIAPCIKHCIDGRYLFVNRWLGWLRWWGGEK
jgi:hypothetical protein